jgi:hypothetical protein
VTPLREFLEVFAVSALVMVLLILALVIGQRWHG